MKITVIIEISNKKAQRLPLSREALPTQEEVLKQYRDRIMDGCPSLRPKALKTNKVLGGICGVGQIQKAFLVSCGTQFGAGSSWDLDILR
jgi:hypothetical protein